MTIDEMRQLKKEYGYSCKQISKLSGVPLGTVQKIFSGVTTSPRHETIIALSKLFINSNTYKRLETYSDLFSETSSASLDTKTSLYGLDSFENKTLNEYESLPEGARIEMIDGVFYEINSPTLVHQRICGMIFCTFENFINKNGESCFNSVAPTDVQLDCDDKTMVQPDILVVYDKNKIKKERVVGAPDLIVEVISPSSWYMDTVRKLNKYKNAGVREYWIVFPNNKSVLVYNWGKPESITEYTFDEAVPVEIWGGNCKVDFNDIFSKVRFLYDD
ncbi:Endonuclease, Uma2 family (restriction endonuclease fold) [Lachnospiraceae bacterium]|nr:Endonuclease, Uma2 family (restriction endonuclease fold) [Lachnospiraceae bacterium]